MSEENVGLLSATAGSSSSEHRSFRGLQALLGKPAVAPVVWRRGFLQSRARLKSNRSNEHGKTAFCAAGGQHSSRPFASQQFFTCAKGWYDSASQNNPITDKTAEFALLSSPGWHIPQALFPAQGRLERCSSLLQRRRISGPANGKARQMSRWDASSNPHSELSIGSALGHVR